MSITACPNCGSKKIFQGRLKDGVLTGYSDKYVCRDCGYQGSPLIFDNIDEYNKFQTEKKSDKTLDEVTANQTLDKEVVLSEKEKEAVDFLNELGDTTTTEIKTKPSALIMFSVVLIFSLIIALFYVPFDFFLPTVLVIIVLFIIVYYRYHIKKN